MEGNCRLFHRGCTPLMSTLGSLLELPRVVLVLPVPVLPVPPLPLTCPPDGLVGVTGNEVLIASMVGVLEIFQLEAPSEVRAYD